MDVEMTGKNRRNYYKKLSETVELICLFYIQRLNLYVYVYNYMHGKYG
jgi:hypothetical protein